ncbi:MAG: hypothetical protein E7399_05025 [Ruminococcaceae bacterium]|nr:hypothetical protein [Oscillospiraceae bacterium]
MKARQAVSLILVLAMCLSFMTAFAETTDYTNTDYYETVVETIDYSDLATDSKFYATETNGNVFYKVNATTGYLHQGDQYASNMFEKPLVNGGEYMIEYKAYTYGISATARNASYGTYLKHNDSGSDYPMLGFKLNVNFGTADYKQVLVTPNFHFRYGKRSTGETLVDTPIGDAFYLNAATWYTFRYIYNLDTKKATMQIYDAAGTTLVKELTYDMPTTVPGKDKTISYDNMKFYYLNASATIIWVGIDDFKIVRTAAKPAVVNFDPNKVSVSYEGKEIKNGETFPIPYNSTTPAKFTVTPKGTNEVSKVLVNNKEVSGTTSFEVTSVKGDTTIDILVKGAPEVKSVTITGTPQVTDVLTATAVITDGDGDKVSAEYQWEFLDGAEWKPITGATNQDYEITDSVLGKQLRVVVTPKSDQDPKTGTPFPSAPTEAVTPYKEPSETEWLQAPMTYEDQEGVSLESATTANAYVIDEGENNYWGAISTSSDRMKAFYLNADNKIMGTSGEYTISHDMKFGAVGATTNIQSAQVSLYYTKSSSNNPNCFMGFGLAPSNVVGTNSVKTDILFHYRWREPGAKSDTETSVVVSDEPWIFNPNEWYSFKHVYNLDSSPKTAKLYIYDSTGKEVKTVTYELPNAIPTSPSGFNPKYDELSFTYVRANVSYGAKIGVDNLAIAKTIRKPVTVSFNDAKVAVSYNNKKVANGGRVMVPYNSETPAVINVTPLKGAVIDKILVDGTDVGTESAQLTSVTKAMDVKILVEEAPVVESVSIDGVVQIGETLTANAKITDINDDNITANYQWQSKEAEGWKNITEKGTEQTYVIPETMLGKQLRVIVTPVSDVEPKTGADFTSAETAAVTAVTLPPSAEDLKVTGEYDVSCKLVVDYKYLKSESNIAEGNSDIIFETADTEDGKYTSVQTSVSKEYVIQNADAGKWMRVRVIPKDLHGVAGAELKSTPVQISNKIAFFVATDGDDQNEGSIEKPFATIEKARDTIRAMKGNLPNVRSCKRCCKKD